MTLCMINGRTPYAGDTIGVVPKLATDTDRIWAYQHSIARCEVLKRSRWDSSERTIENLHLRRGHLLQTILGGGLSGTKMLLTSVERSFPASRSRFHDQIQEMRQSDWIDYCAIKWLRLDRALSLRGWQGAVDRMLMASQPIVTTYSRPIAGCRREIMQLWLMRGWSGCELRRHLGFEITSDEVIALEN